jgi:benzoylformate decarboxylase
MSSKASLTVGKTTVTVWDAVFDLLRELGMCTMFGNPGSTELAFLTPWPTDLRYVLALQEASVVAMADTCAQATGNAAFVNLHSAAGLGNGLGTLYTAFRNQSPLVVTAGQQTRSPSV